MQDRCPRRRPKTLARPCPSIRGLCAGLPGLLFAAFLPLAAQELPAGKGAGLVAAKCFPCHGPEVVTNSAGISRAMWVQVMQDMEALGMEVTPEEYDTIVDYLAKYLGPNPPAVKQRKPRKPETSTAAKPGDAAKLYDQTCAVCHGKDGRGLKNQFPPLAGNPSAGDPIYSALVILYGLEGEIRVQGKVFNGLMPGLPHLSDAQVAALANYPLEAWTADPPSSTITADEVNRLRKQTLTPREVLDHRPQ